MTLAKTSLSLQSKPESAWADQYPKEQQYVNTFDLTALKRVKILAVYLFLPTTFETVKYRYKLAKDHNSVWQIL